MHSGGVKDFLCVGAYSAQIGFGNDFHCLPGTPQATEIMTTHATKQKRMTTALCGLALIGSTTFSLGQSTNPTNTFDNAASTTSFVQWWGGGGAGATMIWDGTLDAANDPNSGSVRYEANFVGNAGEQFMTFFTIANRWQWDGGYVLDATTYTNLSFDLRVDSSSGQRVNNNDFGWLEIGLVTDGWATTYLPGRSIPLSASGAWMHFDYALQPTLANIDKVVGFFIKMWSDGGHTNSLIFNVDNFMITKPTAPVIIPPPTVTLAKAGPSGVQIIMDETYQWQRHAIATPAAGGPYLWTSQGSYPVSYSCTIADFPAATPHEGFEAHMYLVNGDTGGGSQTSGSPDWNVPDIFIFRLENTVAGGAQAQIQWKTNFPNANATNIPVIVDVPSAVGTWTVTFTSATEGYLTGPGVTATNFTLPADAVANNFSPASSFLQFGMFKNDNENDGHNYGIHGTFSRVKFDGQLAAFDDDFSGPTLTDKYAWRKTSNTAVQHLAPGTAWVLDWTLPASGFSAQVAPAVTGPWSPAVFYNSFLSGPKVRNFVAQSGLPAAASGYYRLIKRTFTKLQVLLPGETAAPGTPTGKTGTPTPQQIGVPFDVTVNAVDAEWFRINNVTDTVTITCSDATAALPLDAALVAGTGTFNITLGSPGTFTVTATDVTDGTKSPGTSSTFTANP
jgi:hypothetical protein